MLAAKIIDSAFGIPRVAAGHTILIEDSLGNPIVLAQETADRVLVVLTIRDGEAFNRALAALGIDKVVVEETINGPPPPPGATPLDPAGLEEFIRYAGTPVSRTAGWSR